jgi:hypothetical protein
MSLEVYLKVLHSQAIEVLRDVRNGMFDSQCEVQTMISMEKQRMDGINEINRKACTHGIENFVESPISDEYIRDMTQFQSLLNMTYERSIRKCFEFSITQYNDSFKSCIEKLEECSGLQNLIAIEGAAIDLESALRAGKDPVFWTFMKKRSVLSITSLKFHSETKQVAFEPSLAKWHEEIMGFVDNIRQQICNVQAIYTLLLGSAREDKYVRIFNPEDPFLLSAFSTLDCYLNIIFKFPAALLDHANQYAYILDIDLKKFKRKYLDEDYPIEEYEEELVKFHEAKAQIRRVFYEDWVGGGIFQIEVKKIREKFFTKIDEVNEILFKCVKKKLSQNNQDIEKETNNILAILKQEPKDIEEVTDIKNFLSVLE